MTVYWRSAQTSGKAAKWHRANRVGDTQTECVLIIRKLHWHVQLAPPPENERLCVKCFPAGLRAGEIHFDVLSISIALRAQMNELLRQYLFDQSPVQYNVQDFLLWCIKETYEANG